MLQIVVVKSKTLTTWREGVCPLFRQTAAEAIKAQTELGDISGETGMTGGREGRKSEVAERRLARSLSNKGDMGVGRREGRPASRDDGE